MIIKINGKIISVILLILLIIIGYVFTRIQTRIVSTVDRNNKVIGLNPIEFEKMINKPNTFLLDVHIPEQKHIDGTDVFIPYNEIDRNLSKLPKDKNTIILVYCRSGAMSKEASEKLVSIGYTRVYDLLGGINAYNKVIKN
jgi:rhodanese-related sulfurtransferase